MDLADLARVEVLNGPQGTLFGKNSLGGAIRLVSNQPKGDNTATIEATWGQHSRLDLKAVGDVSLIDNVLSARIVGVMRRQDGIGRYLDFACEMAAMGKPAASGSLPETVTPTQGNGCALGSLGGFDHQGGRVQLRYTPNSDLVVTLNADYSHQADDPPLQTLLTPYGGPTDTFNNNYSNTVVFPKYGINYVNNPNFLSPSKWDNYSTYGDVVTGQQYDPTQRMKDQGQSIVADYRIKDDLHAKVILAHENYQANWINDSDLTPFGLTQTYNQQEHRQYQAEFQLEGQSFSRRLDWVTGLFYYNSKDRDYYPTNFDAFAAPLPPIFPNGILPNFVANDYYYDRNKSAFVHANLTLTDRWSVSAGVRYTDENKGNLFQHYGQIVVPGWKEISASRFDYSGTVNFQLDPGTMLYGSVATGFRSPGFNPRISTIGQLVEVPGEQAINYELGSKSDFLDHRLRVNTAVFYLDYQKHLNLVLAAQCNLASDPDAGKPYQLAGGTCPAGTPLAGTPGISPWFVYTVAPASIRGAELQLEAAPVDRLTLNYSFGFNQFRSKTSDATNAAYVDPSVRLQPQQNMSGGIQYEVPLGSQGSLTPRLDWAYQSYMTNGAVNRAQIRPDWIVPGYSLFNFRLMYAPQAGKWNLAFAATNVFNKFYWQQLGAATTATGATSVARVGTPGMPREWTVTYTRSF